MFLPNALRSAGLRFNAPVVVMIAFAGLAACAGGGTVLRSGDACNAGGSQGIVGSNRAAADAFAAQSNASGAPARVAGPTDALTANVNPSRLNLILDRSGTVISVACG